MSGESFVARSWCRVDLAGGTLDIWPLGLLLGRAATVNVAVGLEVRAVLRRRGGGYVVRQGDAEVEREAAGELCDDPETSLAGAVIEALDLPPVEIELASDSPRGAGLGASSALTVALIAAGEALLGRPPGSPASIARLARDLEARVMRLPTGMQDHYPGLLGGALEILHLPGGEQVRRLEIDLDRLAQHLVIAYSGKSHFSAGNNWRVVRRLLDGDRETRRAFEGIAEAAAGLAPALTAGDLEAVGAFMQEDWQHRRRLAPGISTPTLEELLAQAGDAGAWGGKACGAGGGGCLAVVAPAERRDDIVEALTEHGGEVLSAAPVGAPLRLERMG